MILRGVNLRGLFARCLQIYCLVIFGSLVFQSQKSLAQLPASPPAAIHLNWWVKDCEQLEAVGETNGSAGLWFYSFAPLTDESLLGFNEANSSTSFMDWLAAFLTDPKNLYRFEFDVDSSGAPSAKKPVDRSGPSSELFRIALNWGRPTAANTYFLWLRNDERSHAVVLKKETGPLCSVRVLAEQTFNMEQIPLLEQIIDLQPEHFVSQANHLPKDMQPLHFERAQSAIKRFQTNHCTGQFISNDGYFLTAQHCLIAPLLAAEITLEQSWEHPEDLSKKLIYFFNPTQSPQKSLASAQYISTQLLGLTTDDPVVILLGRYSTLKRPQLSDWPYYSEQMRDIFINADHDFVILKYKSQPSGYSCIPISSRQPQPGEELWSLGYPMITFRTDQDRVARINSKHLLFASRGKLRTGYTELLPYFYSILNGFTEHFDRLLGNNLKWAVDAKVATGMSGGALIDENGELAGINTHAIGMDQRTKSGQALQALRTEVIFKEAQRVLGFEEAQKIFDCKSEAQTAY